MAKPPFASRLSSVEVKAWRCAALATRWPASSNRVRLQKRAAGVAPETE